jgi:hypothetical protein
VNFPTNFLTSANFPTFANQNPTFANPNQTFANQNENANANEDFF